MATDVSSIPINGNYAPHQGYGAIEQQNTYAYNASAAVTQPSTTQVPPASTTLAVSSTSQPPDISKDEVGWYFVEQYYTTLSRSPEKLYLFYNKRSQFVSGQEADKVNVCVGQRAINDRIKELDFQDCKVRVTNVDSQASDSNIVIQVIGAISNKSHPHRKFAQTFVLAAQTNGYFVLNDIFRYLADEEEEAEPEAELQEEEVHQVPAVQSGYEEPQGTPAAHEPETLTSSSDPAAIENDAKQVDKEIEEKVLKEPPTVEEPSQPAVNGVAEAETEVKQADEDTGVTAISQPDQMPTLDSTQSLKEEPEAPKDPEPTPSASPPKTVTPQPSAGTKPAAPKTWASLAASANRVATPATPSTASSASATKTGPTPPSGKTTTPASSAPTAPIAPAAPTAPAAQRDESPAEGSQGDEWTPVGASHNRQQSRQANMQQDVPQNRGYIKNVHEGIDGGELRKELENFGELTHFDVSRPRSCAFVDFRTAEGYNAAVNANPHNVSGDRLYVEERRTRPGSGAYNQRGQYQNNRGGGRGGINQGPQRGNFQGRGGNYAPRGARGGPAPTSRGRGSSQAV